MINILHARDCLYDACCKSMYMYMYIHVIRAQKEATTLPIGPHTVSQSVSRIHPNSNTYVLRQSYTHLVCTQY